MEDQHAIDHKLIDLLDGANGEYTGLACFNSRFNRAAGQTQSGATHE